LLNNFTKIVGELYLIVVEAQMSKILFQRGRIVEPDLYLCIFSLYSILKAVCVAKHVQQTAQKTIPAKVVYMTRKPRFAQLKLFTALRTEVSFTVSAKDGATIGAGCVDTGG